MPSQDPILPSYVSNQVKSLQGLTYSPYQDPLVYWKLLNSAGMDYNGQISMLFDQLEYKLEVKAKFTPHDLLVPGLSILKGSITLDAGASTTAESMLLLQRFPSLDYDDQRRKIAWRSERPLGLTAFQGDMYKLQIKLGSSLGIGTPDLVDSLGLKFSLSVSGSIEGGVEYLLMEAPAPTFYPLAPSVKDRILGGAAAIQRAMDELIFSVDKDVVTDLDNWILERFDDILGDTEKDDRIPGASKLIRALEGVKRKKDRFFSKIRNRLRFDFEKINDWDRVWGDLEKRHPKFVDRWPHFLMFLIKNLEFASMADGSAKRKQTLFDLLNIYAQLYFRLKDSSPTAPSADVSTTSLFEDSITISEEEKAIAKKPQGLTQIRLLAFKGGSKLGVGGTQAAGVRVPILDIKPINSAESASALAMINAGVEVNSKLVSYRFQSFVEGHLLNPSRPRVLHLTQDTYVSYQQAKLGIDILGKLGFAYQDYAEQTKVAEKQIHQSLTYCSVVRYWQPYTADKVFGNVEDSEAKSVKLQSRSGFSYGMSVITRRLIDCAKNTGGDNDLLIAICAQLRITKEKLIALLKDSKIASLDPQQSGLPKVVFIESNFRFPVGQTTQVKKKAYQDGEEYYFEPVDGFKDEDLNRSYEIRKIVGEREGPKEPTQMLESIRIRMRLEDVDSNTQTVFKLGFPKLYVVNFKIKITRIEAAGREACFDLFVQWYKDGNVHEPENPADAQEKAVPPVVLFHLS